MPVGKAFPTYGQDFDLTGSYRKVSLFEVVHECWIGPECFEVGAATIDA